MSTTRSAPTGRSIRRSGTAGLALLTAALLGLAVSAPAAGASVAPTSAEASDESRTPRDLQAIADRLVEAGYPGAIATRTAPDGASRTAVAGTSDLATGSPIPADAEVRVGSASKTFTAVVILQLVDEGRLALDDTVEELLPGVLRSQTADASTITVRHLLQHTSGLPEYADLVAADAFAVRDVYRSPRDMLDLALERPVDFAPGERYSYSNTGYLVLGLIAERIVERPLAEQIDERIVAPLGLEHTYLPAPGDRGFRGDHPNGYHIDSAGELRDLSEADPSWTWAAGAMISTPEELNVFMRAVLSGDLLSAEIRDQMLQGVPTGEVLLPGSTYGLGIESTETSCGTVWGHSGDIPGYQTRNAVAADGTAYTVTVTALPWAIFQGPEEELLERYLVVIRTIDEALCG
jgi:D-alanyl-D-alanine carboxypeptidase